MDALVNGVLTGEAAARAALVLAPALPQALNLLAVELFRRRDALGALRAVGRALVVAPDHADALINAGRWGRTALDAAAECLRTGDLGAAEAFAGALLRLNPGNPAVLALMRLISQARAGVAGVVDPGRSLKALVATPSSRGDGPGHGPGGGARQPRWAVLTGPIRRPDEFHNIAHWLMDARARGLLDGVVFSTWTGELAAHPRLRDDLARAGVVCVEGRQPRLRLKWNTPQQMLALHNGLARCPDDAWVLRCRTDEFYFPFHATFAIDLCSFPEHLALDGEPGLLDRRIAVPNASLLAPFHYQDLTFFGRKTDVRRVVNFDMRSLFLYNDMSTEQCFFAAPFLDAFPIFATYFRCSPGHTTDIATAAAWFDALLADAFFFDVFATHLHVLTTYFRVGGWGRNRDLFAEAADIARTRPAAELLSDRALLPYLRLTFDDYWLAPLLAAGRRNGDVLGRRLCAALERVLDPAFQAAYGGEDALERPEVRDFMALGDRLLAAHGGGKAIWRTRRDPLEDPEFWQAV
jgi:hypothetical protein